MSQRNIHLMITKTLLFTEQGFSEKVNTTV